MALYGDARAEDGLSQQLEHARPTSRGVDASSYLARLPVTILLILYPWQQHK